VIIAPTPAAGQFLGSNLIGATSVPSNTDSSSEAGR
jgi:hypothetical protein